MKTDRTMPHDPMFLDLSNWSQITITGPDRKSYLHSFCTNDINKLKTGECCEAFIPDIKGRILGHVFVISREEHLKLIAVPGANEILTPHLTKYLLGVDATVTDVTSENGLLCLVGEGATNFIDLAVCVNITNLPTYLVDAQLTQIKAVKHQLKNHGLAEGSPELFERLRIEAGFPYVGRDISDANIAQEAARTEQAISFTKGCYLGQEPIARLDAMGHTNKELRGLHIKGSEVVVGSTVLSEENEIGTITSVAQRDDATCVALAMLKSKFTQPGTSVAVVTNTGTFPAKVYWPRFE